MSRSNYCDDLDQWDLICWRGAVASAIRGRRGQQLLREMRDALDALPDKRLIASELVDDDGEYCAMGCVGAKRGLDMAAIDPEEPDQVAKAFDVAEALAREIAYENDEYHRTPEDRWRYMRKWVERHITEGAAQRQEGSTDG